MTIEEAYIKFSVKLNKNLNSNNVTADPARFVLTFNENISKRIIDILENHNNDKGLREIQAFLTTTKLSPENKTDTEVYFKLPTDYLDYSSGEATAESKECGKARIDVREIKDANYSEKAWDEFLKPSFDFRETSFVLTNNKVKVFKEGFDVTELTVNYYRYPKQVDIAGYTKIDGTQSTSVNPEGDNRFLDKVISLTVEDFQRNYQDQLGVQLSKDRIINNN